MFLRLLSTDGTLEPTPEELAEVKSRIEASRVQSPEHLDLWINGRINRELADSIHAELDANICAKTLTVRINSEGGECIPAVNIYILLRRHPAHKTAIMLRQCESAALLVALAADHRIAMPDTSIVFHNTAFEPLDTTGRWTADQLLSKAAELKALDDDFNIIMSQRSGCSVETIAKESETEERSSLAWCLENGFIHEVQQ